jgi:hypothetical protein
VAVQQAPKAVVGTGIQQMNRDAVEDAV